MKLVSHLPEIDLIGLGYDLNFEIKKKEKSPGNSNEPTSLGAIALNLIIYSITDGYLSYFPSIAISNNGIMNNFAQLLLCMCTSISVG